MNHDSPPRIPNVKPSDWAKPQYKYPTVFLVGADIQYDIYHLYAWNMNSLNAEDRYIYYNVAYIPDYKTSVFLNSIFRNIKANRNLDYIEESDDEEDCATNKHGAKSCLPSEMGRCSLCRGRREEGGSYEEAARSGNIKTL